MVLVVFTEEPSMKEALEPILDKLGIAKGQYQIISHQGVSELEKSLRNKLRSWRDPAARFLILRDNDMGNCSDRKRKLLEIARRAGREGQCKVRIVCQELEAWFIGDINALEKSRHLKKPVPKRLRRCDPDQLEKPSRELAKLRSGYGKITGAKKIAPHLDVQNQRSASFAATVSAIRALTT